MIDRISPKTPAEADEMPSTRPMKLGHGVEFVPTPAVEAAIARRAADERAPQPIIGKLLDQISQLQMLWGLNEPGALVRFSDVSNVLFKAGRASLTLADSEVQRANETVYQTFDYDERLWELFDAVTKSANRYEGDWTNETSKLKVELTEYLAANYVPARATKAESSEAAPITNIVYGEFSDADKTALAFMGIAVSSRPPVESERAAQSNPDFTSARMFLAAHPESYFESDEPVARSTFAHAVDHLDDAIKLVDQLDRYARQLAMHLWREHYIKDAPQFELLDDSYGVLSQIDNMLTGLVRGESERARARGEVARSISDDDGFPDVLSQFCRDCEAGKALSGSLPLTRYIDQWAEARAGSSDRAAEKGGENG